MPTLAPPTRRQSDVHLQLLQSVHIASPCPARWEDMRGDDKVRHCDLCNLNVHNLSNMDTDEVAALLARVGHERVCAGMWKRADGTIITQNCPVGLAKARARVARAAGRIAAALGLVIGAAAATAGLDHNGRWAEWGWAIRLSNLSPVQWIRDRVGRSVAPPVNYFGGGVVELPRWTPPPPGAGGQIVGPHWR